jgi:hypothetical protein
LGLSDLKRLALVSAVLLLLMVSNTIMAVSADEASVQVWLGCKLEKLDDRIPGLYTTSLVLSLFSPTNQSFWGTLLFNSPTNRSETVDLQIVSSFNGQIKVWNTQAPLAFNNQEFFWNLFHQGVFPGDSFAWYMVVGLNTSMGGFRTTFGPEPPPELSSKWVVTGPNMAESNNPSDASLAGMGIVSRVYQSYVQRGLTHWYVIQMSFSRQQSDIIRFSGLFWVPAIGLFVIFMVAIVSSGLLWKKQRRLSLSNSLTLFLGSALFAFPFILSINQYAPPGEITPVEYLFYADVILAFIGTGWALVAEYLRPANDTWISQP